MTPPEWIVGADIGGTNIKVGLVPFAGGLPRCFVTRATDAASGADVVLTRVVALVRECLAQESVDRSDVAGVGIGCPGPLDPWAGVVLGTPNLGWEGVNVRDTIGDALGLPAFLDNDGNCAAYGEWWQGAGRGASSLLGLTLGTGVGGGIVLDGRVYRGATGAAGELGHLSVELNGRPCACGSRGCLESYASGPSIVARATEGIQGGARSTLSRFLGPEGRAMTPEDVSEAAEGGDGHAREVLAETGRILGAGLASLANVFNPDAVVIAGSVSKAGEAVLGSLRRALAERAFPSIAARCSVVSAANPEVAGVIGAAGIFKAELFHDA